MIAIFTTLTNVLRKRVPDLVRQTFLRPKDGQWQCEECGRIRHVVQLRCKCGMARGD